MGQTILHSLYILETLGELAEAILTHNPGYAPNTVL